MIYLIMMTLIIALIISMTLMMMCTIISKNMIMDNEKMSPFECGFDPKSSARIPFSIQFFLIAMLFLIFDIEIVIILPMVITLQVSVVKTWFLTTTLFIIILMLGLFHEWKNGVLEWTN
uniref:NADH-ubiquinone oxidoreductase chain 3 n=1 Tax=Enithares tibialis TaxID=575841 RepID=C5HIU5_9HEMI|nr:NADH dehydrogenase subunit 3 [Enithares tibialis]ACJ69540.1 NADH dehydrogenase subunit 3 [Enithares tibialis]